jgi:ubiquinone/menaquinone biosynthesis C-methylase UbiE
MPDETLTPDDLRRRYDAEAERYDEKRYVSPKGRYYMEAEAKLLQKLCAGKKRICDVATGTGKNIEALYDQSDFIVGVDISMNMLHLTQYKLNSSQKDRAVLVQADIGHLPFKDDAFDLVLSSKFFHNVPVHTHRTFFREMERVVCSVVVIELFNRMAWFGLPHFFRRLRHLFRSKGRRNYYPWAWRQLTGPGKKVSMNGFGVGLPLSDIHYRLLPVVFRILNHMMMYSPFKYIAPKLIYVIDVA